MLDFRRILKSIDTRNLKFIQTVTDMSDIIHRKSVAYVATCSSTKKTNAATLKRSIGGHKK